jgi:hypothetical protein
MKKLKSRKDFGEKTSSIYGALTQHMPSSEHEDARRFFLQSTTTRVTILFIMSNFFDKKNFTASDIYAELSPKYGSKSSIVNFISLGLKKEYFCLSQCDDDKRKKYLFPRKEFTKIWCQFISRSEGAPIDKSVNWNEVCSKPCDC